MSATLKKIFFYCFFLSILLTLSPSIVNACVVYSNVSAYENSRVKKNLTPSPFDVKFHKKERIFERRYNLGSNLILRLYTRGNEKSATIFQADLFLGNNAPLPGSVNEINGLIKSLSCSKATGVPATSIENKNGVVSETLKFSSGITVMKLMKNNQLYVLQVFDRKLKRSALTE